jgi:GAF domain-containing protein
MSQHAQETDPDDDRDAIACATVAEGLLDDDHLRASLAAMATLSTGHLRLEDLLRKVAELAAMAIPGADGAGLTMIEEGGARTVVTTAPLVQQLDDIQYGLGQGPCLTAAADQQTVLSGSLGADPRWPWFGTRVARLGVQSAVSLPLVAGERVLGALSVYAHGEDVFDDRAAALAELFAVPAAVAVENARALAASRRLAARLQAALDARGVVNQAVGILMCRSGLSEEQALSRLHALSQTGNKKVAVVARGIVDEAIRRARPRLTSDT